MPFPQLNLRLPEWVGERLCDPERVYPTAEDRMRLVIELSRLNIERGTGGPFGAGVFDIETHRLLAPGVNVVVPCHCSIAHGEMMAMVLAQQLTGSYDLGGEGMAGHELVTSTEPCAMCLGAIPWAGVTRVVCGARESDARAIGFDEGPKHPDWVGELERRGIEVLRDVCRAEAAAVLQQYAHTGGLIYNARQGKS